MRTLLGLLVLPLAGAAQAPAVWGGGVGVGNVLEAHAGLQRQGWLLLGRTQYRWWGPTEGPGADPGNSSNTTSRQLEVAALGGYGVPLGRGLLYAGLGVSYVRGRQLGDSRYAVAKNNLLGGYTYYYSCRDYQVLGLPVELGVVARPLGAAGRGVRLGAALQADFNPERPIYAGVLTCWFGSFGQAARRVR